MKKLIRILLLMSVFILLPAAASAQTWVVFAPGASSKVMTGRMYGHHSTRVYLIYVKAGQKLTVKQVGGGSHTISIVEIKDPTGADVSDMDASCNNNKWIEPTKKGVYRVTVKECTKVDPWRGRFRLLFRA